MMKFVPFFAILESDKGRRYVRRRFGFAQFICSLERNGEMDEIG